VLTSVISPADHAAIVALGGDCVVKPVGLDGVENLAAEIMSICKSHNHGHQLSHSEL
jgi:hypothetical protein